MDINRIDVEGLSDEEREVLHHILQIDSLKAQKFGEVDGQTLLLREIYYETWGIERNGRNQ